MKYHFSLISFCILLCLTLFASPSDERILNIFQISDLHMDTRYSINGDPKNHCHDQNGASTNSTIKLGPAGDYDCDPPALLIESAFKYMKKINPDPDLILWSGDSNPHWDKGPEFEYLYSNIKNITKVLRKYFNETMIIPALGNHDTYPPDQYPDSKMDNTSKIFYAKYIEKAGFGDHFTVEAREKFKECGFYSIMPNIGDDPIKFIVLNTNLYYSNKFPLAADDPCDQLNWTENELKTTPSDVPIFILAHIPPGFYERSLKKPMFNVDVGEAVAEGFYKIFTDQELSSKIYAQFYGHTHTDSFRLFIDSENKARSVGFNSPSVTPSLYLNKTSSHGTNPSLRLYQFDASNSILLDYEQHFLPLNQVDDKDRRVLNAKFLDEQEEEQDSEVTSTPETEASSNSTDTDDTTEINETPDITTKATVNDTTDRVDNKNEAESILDRVVSLWQLSYRATDAFNVSDLTVENMDQVFDEMKSNPEGEIFAQYYQHNCANHVNEEDVCDPQCHTNMMCAMVAFTKNQMDKCQSSDIKYSLGQDGNHEDDTGSTAESNPKDESTDNVTEKEVKDQNTTKPDINDNENLTVPPTTTTPSLTITDNATDENLKPQKTPIVVENGGSQTAKGVAIFLGIAFVLAVAIGGFVMYKKVQKNRYRSQEFLLTDSVFRYDGYSQVDEFN